MPKTLRVTPAAGQRIFPLPVSPDSSARVEFYVNTVGYVYGVDYEVTGNMVVWKDAEFILDSDDRVRIVY